MDKTALWDRGDSSEYPISRNGSFTTVPGIQGLTQPAPAQSAPAQPAHQSVHFFMFGFVVQYIARKNQGAQEMSGRKCMW